MLSTRFIVFLSLIPCLAFAQSGTAPPSAERLALATRFVTVGRLDETAFVGFKASLEDGAKKGKGDKKAVQCATKSGAAPFTDVLAQATLEIFTDAQIKKGIEFFTSPTGKKFAEYSLAQNWNHFGQTPPMVVPQLTAQEGATITDFASKGLGYQITAPNTEYEDALQKHMVPMMRAAFDRCGIPH